MDPAVAEFKRPGGKTMIKSSFGRRTLVATLAISAGLVVPAAASATPAFFGTTADGELVRVEQVKKKPGKKVLTITDTTPITGLPASVTLKGIDQRAKNGDLYGMGSDGVVYRVNTSSGIALALGPAVCEALEGPVNGVDFNPSADRLRVIAASGQNLRLIPDSIAGMTAGACVGGVPDGDIDIAGVTETGVSHAAYTNGQLSPTQPMTTTLFVIDEGGATDTLYTQNPPNDGTLTLPVPISGVDVTSEGGFDILGATGKGYVAADRNAGGSVLAKLNTATGVAKSLGKVGDGSESLTGLAVDQGTGP
jgi:hypothetical protein